MEVIDDDDCSCDEEVDWDDSDSDDEDQVGPLVAVAAVEDTALTSESADTRVMIIAVRWVRARREADAVALAGGGVQSQSGGAQGAHEAEARRDRRGTARRGRPPRCAPRRGHGGGSEIQ